MIGVLMATKKKQTTTEQQPQMAAVTPRAIDVVITKSYCDDMYNSLANVARTGNYYDLMNRPNIPASMQGYITETYKSGYSWYRKWSDGWIEQGGRTGRNSGRCNFVTPFSDWGTVTLIASPVGGGHPDDCYVIVNPVSRSQFDLRASRFTDVSWYACGR